MKRKIPDITIVELNVPAFTKTETRYGIPLEYVSEKLGSALMAAYHINRAIDGEVIAESHNPKMDPEFQKRAPFKGRIAFHAREIFDQSLTAFLALNNMLSIRNEKGIEAKILAMDTKELKRWMDYIETEGSVTSLPPTSA